MRATLFFLILCMSMDCFSSNPAFSDSCNIFYKNEVANTIKNRANFNFPQFEISYCRIHWTTDPAIRYIKGEVTAYIKALNEVNEITLDLRSSLHVDSIRSNHSSLSYAQRNDSLFITLNNQLGTGEMDSLTIFYQGVPGNSGFGTFTNTVIDGSPVMWTMSEPFGARDWWPCKNGLTDKVDSLDIYITTPSQYTAVSIGLRQSIHLHDGLKTTHWKHRYPVASYLVAIAVADYREFESYEQIGQHSLYFQTFSYPADEALFREKTPLLVETMRYFTRLLGTYPFIKEKYGQTQFGRSGGMEHQTNTFLSTPDESLMAHELAHQWFGNTITSSTWNDIWLSEGFATLLASMDMERKYPATIRQTRKSQIDVITAKPGGSVYVPVTTSVSRIFDSRLTYSKASNVLKMLRFIVGDSIFFSAIRTYLESPHLRYGFAATPDFQGIIERTSGRNLDYFFRQWIYGQGYPSYRFEWSQVGADFIQGKLFQTTSDSSVLFFQLPVPLVFKKGQQEKTIIVNHYESGQEVFENIGFIADTVFIDPDYWLISNQNSTIKKPAKGPENHSIRLYPNPAADNITLHMKEENARSASIRMYDITGKLLFTDKLLFAESVAYKKIPVRHLPPGVYLLSLFTDTNRKVTERFIKK